MPKHIVIALTSHDRKGDTGRPTGAYFPEIAHAHAVFTGAGHTVEFVSVRGGAVPLDGTTDPDPTSAAFLADAASMRRLHASAAAGAVRAADHDAIYFAGGHGTMWDFADAVDFQRLTAAIYEAGGVVGAVCHGPAALVNVRLSSGAHLVDGKQVAAFTNEEERIVGLDRVVPFLLEDSLIAAGGVFVGAPAWRRNVVVSERLVTGQNPASATGVAEAMVRLLAADGPSTRADARGLARTGAALSALLLALTAACGDDGGASATDATTAAETTAAETTTAEPTTDATSETGPTTGEGETTADGLVVIPGFDLPESAFWSAPDQAWFVSNIGVEVGAKDGNGFISRLAADGTVESLQWVTGLDGPAGLRGAGGTLYVADVDRLHAIDIATATIAETVTIAGAGLLNDIAVGPDGVVYVSDTMTQSVHAWQPGEAPTLVLQEPTLLAPNGLIFRGDVLHVVSTGSLTDPAVVGQLYRIAQGAVTPVGDHTGKLDGIEVDGADFLVTDFTGKLQRLSGDGATVTLVRDFVAEDGLMSTADFGLDPATGVVAIPDLFGGKVALYTLPE